MASWVAAVAAWLVMLMLMIMMIVFNMLVRITVMMFNMLVDYVWIVPRMRIIMVMMLNVPVLLLVTRTASRAPSASRRPAVPTRLSEGPEEEERICVIHTSTNSCHRYTSSLICIIVLLPRRYITHSRRSLSWSCRFILL